MLNESRRCMDAFLPEVQRTLNSILYIGCSSHLHFKLSEHLVFDEKGPLEEDTVYEEVA